jgi:hypothetical protein
MAKKKKAIKIKQGVDIGGRISPEIAKEFQKLRPAGKHAEAMTRLYLSLPPDVRDQMSLHLEQAPQIARQYLVVETSPKMEFPSDLPPQLCEFFEARIPELLSKLVQELYGMWKKEQESKM